MPAIEALADPKEPIETPFLADVAGEPLQPRRLSRLVKTGFVLAAILALVALWRWTPLAHWAEPGTVETSLKALATSYWGPAIVILIFIGSGLIAFPVTLLIAGTAAAYGLWPGLAYATVGSLASAVVSYYIGLRFGQEGLRSLMGPRINRVSRHIKSQGIFAVTAMRLMPVAPFLLVNLVAGAMRIRMTDYFIGTALGLAPGLLLMSALGPQAMRAMTHPSVSDIGMLAAFLLAWFLISIGLQRLVSRTRSPHP